MKFFVKFYYEYVTALLTALKTVSRNLKGEKFESDVAVLDQFIKPGDTVIDVGGAYGRYAYPIAKIVGPQGRVYSFEPGSRSHRVLKFVVWFHGLKNVVLIKKALSNSEGSINLCSPIKKTGRIGASLAYVSQTAGEDVWSEKVPMTTIDAYSRQANIGSVRFIKCDTEGAELDVYKGAVDVIQRCHPVVLSEVETDHLKRFGYQVKDLEQFFFERGYTIACLKNGVITPVEHITFDGNFYFIPALKKGA
jgi:FkbM family methyltransferase